jgi:hypothetical protein
MANRRISALVVDGRTAREQRGLPPTDTNICGDGCKSLTERAKVEFESRAGTKGPEAIGVKLL